MYRVGPRSVAGLAAAAWMVSLFVPTLQIQGESVHGFGWLLWGIVGLLLGYVEWLANPLFAIQLLAIWCGAPRWLQLAISMALLTLVAVSLTRSAYPVNEGGFAYPVEKYCVGYFLWLGSLVLAAICPLLKASVAHDEPVRPH